MVSRHFPHLTTALVLIALVGTLVGDEPVASSPTDQFRQNLLLLKNRRVVTGKISHTAQGYFVEQPRGSVVVNNEDVLLQAVDLQDAYRKQRELMRQPTTDMRKELASWCMAFNLHEEARREIMDALRMEPDRQDLRRMYVRIEHILNPPQPKTAVASRPRDVAGFQLPPTQSLAGLKRETAREFTRRVQPLLINNCGNAGCHGGDAGGKFHLNYIRAGGVHYRHLVEQNLGMALRFIDADQPIASPLLRIPQAAHGTAPGSAFAGRNGGRQLEILREWVLAVAREGKGQLQFGQSAGGIQQASAAESPAPISKTPGQIRPVDPRPLAGDQPIVSSPEDAFGSPAVTDAAPLETADGPRQSNDDAFFRQLLDGKPADPFDPELFNSRRE